MNKRQLLEAMDPRDHYNTGNSADVGGRADMEYASNGRRWDWSLWRAKAMQGQVWAQHRRMGAKIGRIQLRFVSHDQSDNP